MWPLILSFLSKYYKYLLIPVVCCIIFYVGYFKGHKACEIKDIKEVQKEEEKRIVTESKEVVKVKKIYDKYQKDREINPINDKRDSCILSNDPYEKDCLK